MKALRERLWWRWWLAVASVWLTVMLYAFEKISTVTGVGVFAIGVFCIVNVILAARVKEE